MKAWSLGNFFSSLAVPAGLQKRLVSFLLQRAIGHFLEDDLNLEKLDIELSNGIVHLTDLKLSTAVSCYLSLLEKKRALYCHTHCFRQAKGNGLRKKTIRVLPSYIGTRRS